MGGHRFRIRARRLASLTVILTVLTVVGEIRATTSVVTYAQLLVDHVVFRHREVQSAAIYTAAPTGIMLTATSGVSMEPFTGAAPVATPPTFIPLKTGGLGRVQLPLLDTSGAAAGILLLDFKMNGQPEAAWLGKATAIRDQLQEIVPTQTTLSDPYTKGFEQTDTLAQRITNTLVARHPDLNVLAMHLTAPAEKVNRVWGINRPNFIGRPSDEIDTDTEKTGRIVMQVIPATHRLEVHMPLLDQTGTSIGTLCTVYFWHDEREAGDLFARSLGLRDEARLLMPARRDDLFKP